MRRASSAKRSPTSSVRATSWRTVSSQLVARTEDVGERFAEEARRIHYGEEAARGIRGQATPQERAALHDEGIETMSIPMPSAMKGPVQ